MVEVKKPCQFCGGRVRSGLGPGKMLCLFCEEEPLEQSEANWTPLVFWIAIFLLIAWLFSGCSTAKFSRVEYLGEYVQTTTGLRFRPTDYLDLDVGVGQRTETPLGSLGASLEWGRLSLSGTVNVLEPWDEFTGYAAVEVTY